MHQSCVCGKWHWIVLNVNLKEELIKWYVNLEDSKSFLHSNGTRSASRLDVLPFLDVLI